METNESLLRTERVSKNFFGLLALDKVDLQIRQGDIFSLIGPNGAGKTTLFNLITRVLNPSEGRIFLKEKEITNLKPHRILRLGISRTFQNIRLFSNLNALEIVMGAQYARTKSGLFETILCLPSEISERKDVEEKAEEILKMFGLYDKRLSLSTKLGFIEQRRLEIARAYATDPDILLLDEPSAGTNPSEAIELMELILKLKEAKKTIFLIEHNMRVVMGVSDRIAVLNFGKKIAEGSPKEIQENPAVIDAYLGTGI